MALHISGPIPSTTALTFSIRNSYRHPPDGLEEMFEQTSGQTSDTPA
jgi:hypothetical protein